MQVTRFGKMIWQWQSRVMTLALTGVLALAFTPRLPVAAQQLAEETTPPASETPDQLQQLVAPIALYPDALVAQILAAATYPTEIVQADRWLQQHSKLQGEQLASAADKQSWDPSVKALTAFPSVLANLDKNLSWTEALGDAYFNQQQDVLDAVQILRRRAEDAGNLRSTPQQTVVSQGATIVIQPVEPDVCYLPSYDPWIVYGAPLAGYPGYFYDPWYGPPFISFGPAIGLSFFGGFGWGWPAWGFNWGRRVVVFNHNTYVSRSRYFAHRGPFGGGRGVGLPRRITARTNHAFNNRNGVAPNARFSNGWANRGAGAGAPRASAGSRFGPSFGRRPDGVGREQNSRGGSAGSRPSFSGGRSFGGGARGGGSRGGGSRGGGGGGGGRHR